MKPFGQWVMEDQTHSEEEVELVSIYCCVCDREMDLASYGIDPEDVDEDSEFYCGGSPSCCP